MSAVADDWLRQRARAARDYIDCKATKDGAWVVLEKPDGSRFSVPEKDWPEIERLAREQA